MRVRRIRLVYINATLHAYTKHLRCCLLVIMCHLKDFIASAFPNLNLSCNCLCGICVLNCCHAALFGLKVSVRMNWNSYHLGRRKKPF